MKILLDWTKQYNLLALILMLVFGASGVLIVFERVQKQEAASQLASENVKESLQAVQGQNIISDKEIASYQQFASQTFKSVQDIIKDVSGNSGVNQEAVKSLESTLLSAKVPLPYQELHFALLKIVRNLRASEGPNLDFLEEQSRLLAVKYLWL